jgi:DNA modification methylase
VSAFAATSGVGRRSELTFRQNLRNGRHGWLRLTPAYSVELIQGLLQERRGARVLEPFAGSGTTALAASELGLEAWAFDINPFLIWLGRAKVSHFAAGELDEARRVGGWLADSARSPSGPRSDPPPLRNIERWWTPARLELLCALKAGIDAVGNRPARTLLLVAFCKTLMTLSNAAFDHPSMSFGAAREPCEHDLERFPEHLASVLAGCSTRLATEARIEHGDARVLDRVLPEKLGHFDLLITSPPYPNRMSYVRELRPYLYWLGYFSQAREAGELDWRAIGGTWGVATSRLSEWSSARGFVPDELVPLLSAIREQPTSGPLMAAYVHRYFEDMAEHLAAVQRLLAPGGEVHYIVGNSTFYGVTVPTERLLAAELSALGFHDVEVFTLRKRNSKKELFEFRVSARRS